MDWSRPLGLVLELVLGNGVEDFDLVRGVGLVLVTEDEDGLGKEALKDGADFLEPLGGAAHDEARLPGSGLVGGQDHGQWSDLVVDLKPELRRLVLPAALGGRPRRGAAAGMGSGVGCGRGLGRGRVGAIAGKATARAGQRRRSQRTWAMAITQARAISRGRRGLGMKDGMQGDKKAPPVGTSGAGWGWAQKGSASPVGSAWR